MSAPTYSRRIHRTGLALLASLVLVGVLGFARPAAALPQQPRVLVVQQFNASVRIYFAPNAVDTAPATKYRITRERRSGQTWVESTVIERSSAKAVDWYLPTADQYRFRVQAYADGWGQLSPWAVAQRIAGRTELDRFGDTGYGAFVDRTFDDFLGYRGTPKASEKQAATTVLANGASTASVLEGLVNRPERINERHKVIRLYFAYFDRAPDHGGLAYWANKRRTGTILDVVSSNFAGSNEFKNTYGNLSNGDFVDLVYHNVLDREPDAAGKAHWVGQLAKGTSRGRVMTQFSEANEYVTKSRGEVLAADVHDAMVHAPISASDLEAWSSHLQAGGTAGGYAAHLAVFGTYGPLS